MRHCPERSGGPEKLPGAVSTQDQPIVGSFDARQPFFNPVIESYGLDVEFWQHVGANQQREKEGD